MLGPHALLRAMLVTLAVGCALSGCGPKAGPPEPTPADTTARADSIAALDTLPPARPEVRYTRAVVSSPAALFALRDSLGERCWRDVLRINRVDSAHVRRGDTLIVPVAAPDSLALSPFPLAIPAARDTAKLLLVSLRVQAFAAYEYGRLARWGPVNTGRRTMPTPVGLYHVNWKAKSRVSTFSDEWLLRWCLNIDSFEGVSLHQYDLPGYPASHSCVRLGETDAMALYAWADTWRVAADGRTIEKHGTPVVVFGEWAWKRRAPWKRLPEDSLATTLGPEEIAQAMQVMSAGVRPVYVKLEPPPPARPDTSAAPVATPADSISLR